MHRKVLDLEQVHFQKKTSRVYIHRYVHASYKAIKVYYPVERVCEYFNKIIFYILLYQIKLCTNSTLFKNIIRVIPQGTVDNNLGPDNLAGLNALDPNYCRQSTLLLHDLCLEVLTVHGIELRLFWDKAFNLLILPYYTRSSDIATVGRNF